MKYLKYILIALSLLSLFIFRDFTPNNELKYLSIADEALKNGHFFAFFNHGIAYADKPPLYLWIVMLGKWLFGYHSMLFLGLFSLIPALITVMVMNDWCKQYLSRGSVISATLMMMTTCLFVGATVILRMDMLMCMFIVLALRSFYMNYTGQGGNFEKWKFPIYVFMAIFSKGPVGIIIPLITIPTFLFIKKDIKTIGKYWGLRTWIILLVLCAIWFSAVYMEGGKSYLDNLLFNQTVNRAVDSFHHKKPFYYYFVTMWYSFAPWVLLYVTVIISASYKKLFNNDIKKLFLVVICTTLIALSLISGKLDIYMLPIFPFVVYLSLMLIHETNSKLIQWTILIPAVILALAFPLVCLIPALKTMPFLQPFGIKLTILCLSIFALISIWFIYRKSIHIAIDALASGILIAAFFAGFSFPKLNPEIGFKAVAKEALQLSKKNNINNFSYYKFRSGDNLDVFLEGQCPLKIDSISQFENIGKSVVFVRNKDIAKDEKLKTFLKDKELINVGSYYIFIND